MTCKATVFESHHSAAWSCSCGSSEDLDPGTLAEAQTLADEHVRLAKVLAEATP